VNPLALPLFLLALYQPAELPSVARARFPNQEWCQRAVALNRAYREAVRVKMLDARYSLSARHLDEAYYERAMDEADQVYGAWCALTLFPGEPEREREDPDAFWGPWMERLAEKLTPEDYAAGQMPPPVPWVYVGR
jgi:hypothetical protein